MAYRQLGSTRNSCVFELHTDDPVTASYCKMEIVQIVQIVLCWRVTMELLLGWDQVISKLN